MQDLVETLNVLPPLLLIGGLTLFLTLETVFPYFEHGAGRRRQRWRNVGMIAIAAAINATIGSVGVLPIAWSEASSFGLLYHVTGHSVLTIVAGVFLVDLCSYALHVTMHKVPALWRIHRVHHSSHRPETDSHYGCVFSVWDRLFGTTRKTHVETIRFGLERFRGPGEQNRLGAVAHAVSRAVTDRAIESTHPPQLSH